jgi:hypothetical protein
MMTHLQDYQHFSNAQLAAQCAVETKSYLRKEVTDTAYCFELFRRACEDGDNEALTLVYQQYFSMLVTLAKTHPAFASSSQDVYGFATTAFSKFYDAVKGEGFASRFASLDKVLQYLKLCVHTEILLDIRQNKRNVELNGNLPAQADRSDVGMTEIWARICIVLPKPDDQRLAYLRFLLAMKPAEIALRYPELGTAAEITQKISRIRQKLRKDDDLRGMMGIDSSAE